ncbi:MerR family transcriptional regulator [Leptotrichia sp. HSP-334]|uniref:MerR family transcriptional regulator n=1 Tax=Leptotrichia rugosa TaxID=3239302 RepID=A0AB39VFZ1_9FUSO
MVNVIDFDETTKLKELAKVIGLSERHLQRLSQEGIIKKNDKGKYLLYESIRSYINYLKEIESTPQQLQEEKLKNEIEYLKTRDRKENIKIKILEADLHEASDVKRVMNNIISGFKGQLQTIPYKLAPLVIGIDNLGEIQEIITNNINSVLLELSEYDRSKFLKNREYVNNDDEEGQ